ncbi:uncharacterized protein LOC109722893 [Ananas comosus]|uniref:Uncharacterized protein LOC109722893 n=1 Tax=Ananas comosus TaxID=4615 RepID=A0A6P5GMS9_ANACO|nr:uncharacterized protein LOC109722893 [Ananas comosus]
MAPRGCPSTRSAPAPPPEVPGQTGSDEVREMRAQVAALAGAMWQQGEQIGQLHELMAQQAAVAAPVSQDPPAPVAPERLLAVLTAFKRFNPPTFNGNVKDLWLVESWLAMMEALFEDIYTLEKDKVHPAAHCFQGSARLWWTQAKKSHSLDLASVTWEAFREMLLMEYFSESDKRKIKEDFHKLRQGSQSVREYEREFTHLVNCVPSSVERGNAIAREECEAFEMDKERDKSKKRAASGSAGQSSSKQPPRPQRSQWRGGRSQTQSQTTYPSVICGGDHRVTACPQREGRYFQCGQAGHIGRECPGGASPASSSASVQYTQRQLAGLPPAMSAGRSSAPQSSSATTATADTDRGKGVAS